jgi:hypothetical protein
MDSAPSMFGWAYCFTHRQFIGVVHGRCSSTPEWCVPCNSLFSRRSVQRLNRLGAFGLLRRRMATDRRACDCRRRFAPTDRQAASHEVLIVPFSVCWPRRTARGEPCPGLSRFGVLRFSAPTPISLRPCGFRASRFLSAIVSLETPLVWNIRGLHFFQPRTRSKT